MGEGDRGGVGDVVVVVAGGEVGDGVGWISRGGKVCGFLVKD